VPSHEPLLTQVGQRIRNLRVRRGWSQERLADESGVDRSYMSGIERGVRNISILTLAKVALALGVSPSSLLQID
jgi:transcriptional regulator with XRE-family HTH domain